MSRIGVVSNVATDHLAGLTSERIELEEIQTRLGGLARTVADRALVDIDYLDAAIRVDRRGVDAVFVNTFADYNLAAMKSALDIPVVGAGESTMHTASMLGERFAIVTVWPQSMRHIYRDLLREYRLEEHCAAIVHAMPEEELDRVGTEHGVKERMKEDDETIVDRLGAACRTATQEHGADTVVLGCTCMAPVAKDLKRHTDADVVCPSRTGFLATETLLRLGYSPSEIAHTTPPTDSTDRVTALVDGAESQFSDDDGSSTDECEICVTSSDGED
jgi:allantoin racemase